MKKILSITILAILATGCSQTVITGKDCKVHNGKRMSCKHYDIKTTDKIRLIKD